MQPPPGPEAVTAQLERVLASPAFATSARLRDFLEFIVEQTLAGRAAELKEYGIGVDVFGRGADYDPRIDSIVRVEAGRLRAKLDDYYATTGAGDAVRIRVPRGTYVPVFEARDAPPPAARRPIPWMAAGVAIAGLTALAVFVLWRPASEIPTETTPVALLRVAVLPFASYSTDAADRALADRLSDRVSTELARINAVAVVSRTSTADAARHGGQISDIARILNAGSLIEGTVTTDASRIRVRTRIVGAVHSVKTNVRDFEGARTDPDALARRIAESLSETYKLVQRSSLARVP